MDNHISDFSKALTKTAQFLNLKGGEENGN